MDLVTAALLWNLSPSMAPESAATPPDTAGDPGAGRRAFTVKALAFGLALALVVVVGAWFNDQYLEQSPAIGNFFPPLPIGLALLLAVLWNPLAGRIAALRFSVRELAVVLCLSLVASWLPVSGFFRYFQRAIIAPQVIAPTKPEWRQTDVLGHLPPQLFPLGGSAEAAAFNRAMAAERAALADGTLQPVLAGAGADAAGYATALDLAGLLPPRRWDDGDRALVRTLLERAWIREFATDPARWAAAGELLKGLPAEALEPAAGSPAWPLALARLDRGYREALPAAKREFDAVYTGLMQGLTVKDELLPLAGVPWAAWLPTLVFWTPLVLFLCVAVVMLSLLVHRQWSHHEQLTYPIASVATALIQRDGASTLPGILRNRLLWAGAVPVLLLHLLNYLAAWFPGYLPSISLHWNQWDMIATMVPTASQAGGVKGLASGDIYFTVIGLAFFISSEVSFSMGITGFIAMILAVGWYSQSGQTVDFTSLRSGAYIGFALVLLYTGRTYYWAVARRALGLGGGAAGELAEATWAARLFLLGFAGFVGVLIAGLGLDWFVALVYGLVLMVMFLVVSRVVCETGVPFIQPMWQPAQVMTCLLGIGPIGAAPLALIHYLGVVLSMDPRECLMPYMANAYKVAENTGVRRLRLGVVGLGMIAIALVVGFVAITWGMYNFGANKDTWAAVYAPQGALDRASRDIAALVDTGQYAASATASGLGKLPLIGSSPGGSAAFGWLVFGLAAVVGVALMRFRFTWFYFHPVLFLVLDTYPAVHLWLSFIFGWCAKVAVVRFGGGRVYQNLKPLFIGLILGELAAVLITLGTGWIYHLSTGLKPKVMLIFAG